MRTRGDCLERIWRGCKGCGIGCALGLRSGCDGRRRSVAHNGRRVKNIRKVRVEIVLLQPSREGLTAGFCGRMDGWPGESCARGRSTGEVQEWLNWHAWKVCIGEILSRVRIPPSPQLVSQTFRRKPVDRVLTGFLLSRGRRTFLCVASLSLVFQ